MSDNTEFVKGVASELRRLADLPDSPEHRKQAAAIVPNLRHCLYQHKFEPLWSAVERALLHGGHETAAERGLVEMIRWFAGGAYSGFKYPMPNSLDPCNYRALADLLIRQINPPVGCGQSSSRRVSPAEIVTIERIRQLAIPPDYLPVLVETAREVLMDPDRFIPAANRISEEIQDWPRNAAASRLYELLVDAAECEPPSLSGEGYAAWTDRLMLLTTLAVYPGDLSCFGACGEIQWAGGDIEDEERRFVDIRLGRSHILFERPERLREQMLDQPWETVKHSVSRVVNGKPVDCENIRQRGQHRGVLGRLVDRLSPILDELRAREHASAEVKPANKIAKSEPVAERNFGPAVISTNHSVQRARRGRLSKEESEAKRAQMLATIRQHSSLKDDPAKLSGMVGVSESTIRRWLDDEEQKYRESKAANAALQEE